MSSDELTIGGMTVHAGETVQIDLPVAKLYTDSDISLPVHVIRGKQAGPTVFVAAAVHGDELNGMEIVRRLIQLKSLKVTAGTLILVPMVNAHGVLNQSRYMPDRRDLNRSFPGSKRGSLASRVAHIFFNEVVKHCDYGIDLHTGAVHRSNLPQVRANLKDQQTLQMAEAFGVPVLLNAKVINGSLRKAAVETDTRILVYEAGEALRFDEVGIRIGVSGVLNVLDHHGLIKRKQPKRKTPAAYTANNSSWVRANASGIVKDLKGLGDQVEKGEALAEIGSPSGEVFDTIKARESGIVIGKQNIPLVQEGDAMFHVAFFSENSDEIAEHIDALQETHLT